MTTMLDFEKFQCSECTMGGCSNQNIYAITSNRYGFHCKKHYEENKHRLKYDSFLVKGKIVKMIDNEICLTKVI